MRVPGRAPRTVVVREGSPGTALVEPLGRAPGVAERDALTAAVAHLLRLDDDLSPFYDRVRDDADLGWVTRGAGRLMRSATPFEDVVKTLCTTNCTWSATVRMTTAFVEHLGEQGPHGRAFPTPEALAEAPEAFYRDVVRAGYRGAYLRSLAAAVASREVDLDALTDQALPDDEVEQRLVVLPGIGPYAAAHTMLLLGRYSRLVLDSWTRPTYTRLSGARRPVPDKRIEARFRRYGRFAGLAFWLYLTAGWAEERGTVAP